MEGGSRRTQVVPTVGESLDESRPVSNVVLLPAVLSWFEFSTTPASTTVTYYLVSDVKFKDSVE